MERQRLRVLIVDDSSVIRFTLRAILEKHGFQVAGEAVNGLSAVELYRELRPDLVMLDVVMPKMNGIETLRALKELDPAARVLMVSAMANMARVEECARYGAEHYIVKPFEEEKVVEVLNMFFPDRIS
jgi:two-component system chemotaxis response regulator CheY